MITFVPLHSKKLHERSFNQSEILALKIARACNLPAHSCLEKTSHTKNQNDLTRQERLKNLTDAFRIKASSAHLVRGRRILLIDDVMTTGATLNECSRVLKNGGALEVRCLTLARGI
ncbi:MAG: hypothetical protein NC938_05160 [Candidatus Omnitrophica bacterium]|nr:hypothetical protein [Candidatus Omnitrophota bacterium]MCM8791073.1 hypothetical protein [Candidatus Omnitrophota bacterium]